MLAMCLCELTPKHDASFLMETKINKNIYIYHDRRLRASGTQRLIMNPCCFQRLVAKTRTFFLLSVIVSVG